MKPVASGCVEQQTQLRSEDALALQQASSIQLPYQLINPFAFKPPISPHLAARMVNCHLTVAEVSARSQSALQYPADICIIEGVGGWDAPLNDTETMADYVVANQLDVILVVGMRLGCLNHAILTYRAIQQCGANLVGWIANCIDPNMLYREENIATLKHWLPVPCLEVIEHRQAQMSKIIGN